MPGLLFPVVLLPLSLSLVPGGFVLGLDLQPLPLTIPLAAHVRILRQDVFDWQVPDEFKGSFDVLLSDMAPSTSGIKLLDANSSHELCHQALQVAQTILKPNGTLVMVSPIDRGREQTPEGHGYHTSAQLAGRVESSTDDAVSSLSSWPPSPLPSVCPRKSSKAAVTSRCCVRWRLGSPRPSR